MISRINITVFLGSLCVFCVYGSLSGCSTTEVVPFPLPSPPVYTQVPHPVGMDLGDLAAIFTDDQAPQSKDFAKTCDADFRKLEKLTGSRDETLEGFRELVKLDAVTYHWCFYAKLLALESDLKAGIYIDERQKTILDAFSFLAPLARIYASEFHDSRYLRMAIMRYQKWSERIFYRKLELTPVGTSELVKASNPFGLWRDTLETVSVLEKYHILKSREVIKAEVDVPPLTAPVSMATAIPTPEVSNVAVPSSSPDVIKEAVLPSANTSVPAKKAAELGTSASDLPMEL